MGAGLSLELGSISQRPHVQFCAFWIVVKTCISFDYLLLFSFIWLQESCVSRASTYISTSKFCWLKDISFWSRYANGILIVSWFCTSNKKKYQRFLKFSDWVFLQHKTFQYVTQIWIMMRFQFEHNTHKNFSNTILMMISDSDLLLNPKWFIVFFSLTTHCRIRDKSSTFLSAVLKNLIFLCSF